MADEFEYMMPALEVLARTASAKHKKLDPTFVLQLENYTLRRGTRRLSPQTKQKIVEEVGRGAIEWAVENKTVGDFDGLDVGMYLTDHCEDPFGLCYTAAQSVVEKHGKPEEVLIMQRIGTGEG